MLQYTIIDESFQVAEDPFGRDSHVTLEDVLTFPPGEQPATRNDSLDLLERLERRSCEEEGEENDGEVVADETNHNADADAGCGGGSCEANGDANAIGDEGDSDQASGGEGAGAQADGDGGAGALVLRDKKTGGENGMELEGALPKAGRVSNVGLRGSVSSPALRMPSIGWY